MVIMIITLIYVIKQLIIMLEHRRIPVVQPLLIPCAKENYRPFDSKMRTTTSTRFSQY